MIGVEPTWIAPLDPKSSASANFATPAAFKDRRRPSASPSQLEKGAKLGLFFVNS